MKSFSPEDVIFLLNKWDSISHLSVEKQETFFEDTKSLLKRKWKEVDDSNFFKISAVKVLHVKCNFIGITRKKRILLRNGHYLSTTTGMQLLLKHIISIVINCVFHHKYKLCNHY